MKDDSGEEAMNPEGGAKSLEGGTKNPKVGDMISDGGARSQRVES